MSVIMRGWCGAGRQVPWVIACTRVEAPALCWSLAQIKAHLKIDVPDEDSLLDDYQRAATRQIEEDAGLKLLTQTWDLQVDGFPTGQAMDLRRFQMTPVQSLTSVSYVDGAGALQTWSASDYIVAGSEIGLADVGTWPTDLRSYAPVTIRVVVGYAGVELVPEDLRHLVRLLVGTHVQHRELSAFEQRYYDQTIARYVTTLIA